MALLTVSLVLICSLHRVFASSVGFHSRASIFYTGFNTISFNGSQTFSADNVLSCMRLCKNYEICAAYAFSPSFHCCVLYNNTEVVQYVSPSSNTIWQLYHMIPACPVSWIEFNDMCYFFNGNDNVQWSDAKAMCENESAQLVEIESKSEDSFIKSVMKTINASSKTIDMFQYGWWLGGNDLDVEGTWRWVGSNNMVSGYKNWFVADPNNFNGNEHCMMSFPHFDYVWIDYICTKLRNFVCERNKTI